MEEEEDAEASFVFLAHLMIDTAFERAVSFSTHFERVSWNSSPNSVLEPERLFFCRPLLLQLAIAVLSIISQKSSRLFRNITVQRVTPGNSR